MIWGILAFSNLIVSVNCTQFKSPELNIFITIGNVMKLGTPFVLSILRFKDPLLKKKSLEIFNKFGFFRNFNKVHKLKYQQIFYCFFKLHLLFININLLNFNLKKLNKYLIKYF